MSQNTKAVNSLLADINTDFNTALAKDPKTYLGYCSEIKPELLKTYFSALFDTSGWKEWVSTRETVDPLEINYDMVVKDFSNGIKVDRNTIDDDQSGLYKDLAEDKARGWNEFLLDFSQVLLAKGTETSSKLEGFYDSAQNIKCYDDGAYFATDHTFLGQSAQSNYLTGAQYEFGLSALALVQAHMFKLKNPAGNYFRVKPDTIMTATNIYYEADNMFKTDTLLAGAGDEDRKAARNPLKDVGIRQIFNNPWLDDDQYILMNTSRVIKPVVSGMKQLPRFMVDDDVKKKFIEYFLDARCNFVFGHWFDAVLVDPNA